VNIPAKYTAKFINGNAFKPSDWGDEGLPILRIAQLSGQEFDNYFNDKFDERYRVLNGDLLFAWSATIDSYLWYRGEAVLNQHIFKIIPAEGVNKKYLFYSLKHYSQIWADIDGHGSTTRHIKKESLRNKIFLPDSHTQKAVADFLDREIARIDQLIEKKHRLTRLLRDKQLLMVDGVVTCGLDRTRTMRSTAIPWLPEIPDHWKLEKAKRLFKEAQRLPQDDDEIITAFRDGQVTLRTNRRSEGYTFAVKEVGYQHIQAGDLVIHTMDAFAGAIGVSDSNGKATGEYAVCVTRSNRVNAEYYARLLRCMARRNYIFILCPSVRERAPRFRFVRFAPILLPVPPREEQDTIVQCLTPLVEQMRIAREKTELSLKRLNEFRSALITAAVTGQIDVSAWGKHGTTDQRLDHIEAEMAAAAPPEREKARA
jgi:type I restriction enzyme S subunit